MDVREGTVANGKKLAEQLISILLGDNLDKAIQIGSLLDLEVREWLIIFFRANADIFAWIAIDMLGILADVIVHKLSMDPYYLLVNQKKFCSRKAKGHKMEVNKLLKTNFIKETHYRDWIANIVIVKKANSKWRICIDYTNFNKACSKYSYLLPRIDQLVDATSEHELLSFMDAF